VDLSANAIQKETGYDENAVDCIDLDAVDLRAFRVYGAFL